ncbi:hypothetical protein ACHAWF_004568 [Thalassiosira exigua]
MASPEGAHASTAATVLNVIGATDNHYNSNEGDREIESVDGSIEIANNNASLVSRSRRVPSEKSGFSEHQSSRGEKSIHEITDDSHAFEGNGNPMLHAVDSGGGIAEVPGSSEPDQVDLQGFTQVETETSTSSSGVDDVIETSFPPIDQRTGKSVEITAAPATEATALPDTSEAIQDMGMSNGDVMGGPEISSDEFATPPPAIHNFNDDLGSLNDPKERIHSECERTCSSEDVFVHQESLSGVHEKSILTMHATALGKMELTLESTNKEAANQLVDEHAQSKKEKNSLVNEKISNEEPLKESKSNQPDLALVAQSLPEDVAALTEKSQNDCEHNIESIANLAKEHTEERTQEEEEWLSMGLGLGDALRQIVALTEERDTALAISQEREDRKAEFESEVRRLSETLTSYEARLKVYESIEDDLEKCQAEKRKMELESEQKEVVLSNRLNEAKKKEANQSTAAGRLEADNETLREDLTKIKHELESTMKVKAKLESNMEKLKAKAVERVKQAEISLKEERELNEERKRKMKVFVETKAEELREAKDGANDMQKELEETRASLRSSRDRGEALQKELETATVKNRDLSRDIERMKRNSEQLSRIGNCLEQELEKSTSETEEHRKKRMSAKHEIMQMVRTLEGERAVSSKLRESLKFTFTPKALSQQELLTECLKDFELELERLAAKMGKALLPSSESGEPVNAISGEATSEINGASKKSRRTRAAKADFDTDRLISNLEQETQHVSKGIMALAGSIERMRSLLSEESMFGCMTYLTNIIAGSGEVKHQRLGSEPQEEHTNSDHFV